MKITFYGGAQSVTGSNYLLDNGKVRLLVDCGLFQGTRYSEEDNYADFKYDASKIDYVLITHSHVDHIGRLPKLYREGFRGTVLATEPTVAITKAALPDTLDHILDEAREMGHEPLYSKDDMHGLEGLMKGIGYSMPQHLAQDLTVTFHEASHILGSAIIEIVFRDEKGEQKRILFTGDLGNPPTPLLNPIDYVNHADYVVIESAYGNRIHEDRDRRRDILLEAIVETIQRGGVLMIPSFAVERTQELLLELDHLIVEHKIPRIPIFVDSPLAIKITKAYGEYSHYFNQKAEDVLEKYNGLFKFPWLTFTSSTNESKKINDIPSPKIIIAGSGMSQGGRIIHHERRYLQDPKSTILFVGYQVAGSLGRRIFNGESPVKIMGEDVPVRCHIKAIGGYSAHADQNGLIKFVQHAKAGDRLEQVFVVQGESESAQALVDKIQGELHVHAIAPMPDQSFSL